MTMTFKKLRSSTALAFNNVLSSNSFDLYAVYDT